MPALGLDRYAPRAVRSLLCPVCRNGLMHRRRRAALACRGGHSFDAARQGYFNFLVGKGTVFEADTADMVAARFDFLVAGALPAPRRRGRRAGGARAAGAARPRRARRRNRNRPLPAGRAGPGPGRCPACRHRTGHLQVRAAPRRQAEPRGREPGQRCLAAAAGRGRRRRRRHGGLRAPQRGGVRPGAPPRRPAGGGDAAARATLRRLPARPACSASSRRRTNGWPRPSTAHFESRSVRDLDLDLALAPADVGQPGPDGPGRPPPGPRRAGAIVAGLPPVTAVSARFRISVFRTPDSSPGYRSNDLATFASAARRPSCLRPAAFGLGWKDSY